uniref:SPATS2-like protein n=1 Tax=Syphacia muris TaxID=451379 RepID=A0A0N5AQQ8_9BILA
MASTKHDMEERKRMEQAVAKVREVVHTASKNDIMLALHIYDMDVDRTIQAFCDDGAQSALGSWERTGVAKKKNRKKKKADSNTQKNTEVTSANVPATHAVSSTQNTSTFKESEAARSVGVTTSEQVTESLNPILNKSTAHKKPELSPKGSPGNRKSDPALVIEPQRSMYKGTESEEETCSLAISNLKNFGEETKSVESAFEKQLDAAEDNIRAVFMGIRQLLADRESHLLAEVKRIHDDGVRVLAERRVKANELLDRSKRIKAMSDREKKGFRNEITRFCSERNDEADFEHTSRFVCDNKTMIKMVKNFGEVVGIKNSAATAPVVVTTSLVTSNGTTNPEIHVNEEKISLGHRSHTSSVGEDSGLGQISPTGDDHKIAEVNDGGILMKSDALTPEQLADLNAKVRETLQAQGIDASLFCELTKSTRRRQGAGARARQRAQKPSPQLPDPQLSIFE